MNRHLSADPMTPEEETPRVSTLVGGIIGDVQKLVRQELILAKEELRQEWTKTKAAAQIYTAAAAVVVIAMLLFGIAIAEGLVSLGLASWGAYALAAVLFAGAALALFTKANKVKHPIELVPSQTVERLKENMQWIRKQT